MNFDPFGCRRLDETQGVFDMQQAIESGEFLKEFLQFTKELKDSPRVLQEENPDIVTTSTVTFSGCLFEVSSIIIVSQLRYQSITFDRSKLTHL
jgi:hypothetical protein